MRRMLPTILLLLMPVFPQSADSASITVYGLESATFDRIFDPDARPEQLLLVSGSLKLIGQAKGTWGGGHLYSSECGRSPFRQGYFHEGRYACGVLLVVNILAVWG